MIFTISLMLLKLSCAEIWHSSDGQNLEGEGLYWTEGGVLLKRSDTQEVIGIKYEKLIYKDVLKAVNDLDYFVNDAAKAYSKTVSTKSVRIERETGRYHLFANLHTYDGYHYSGTGKLIPLTKKVRLSGRIVEVNLSSLRGDGVAGIEFYALRGTGSQKPSIYHAQLGVFAFLKNGSPRYFSAPSTENFIGWVVLVRSPITGEVIDINSSLRHLEKYVLEQVPTVADFKINTTKIKREVLEKAKRSNAIKSVTASRRPTSKKATSTTKSKKTATIGSAVYICKIDQENITQNEQKAYVLTLSNEGVVQINLERLGYVGSQKEAVLFEDESIWKIWIEGKKTYRCDVLKTPIARPSGNGEKISVTEVKANGKIISTLSSGQYSVSATQTFESRQWIGNFDALLIDRARLLNLEEGGELIDVRKIK
ncbi:hypothetical protein N9A88_03460 [Akkermansiaceae bacterium]|nr:hypothetical protein [Akkermansiaceae bacterium]